MNSGEYLVLLPNQRLQRLNVGFHGPTGVLSIDTVLLVIVMEKHKLLEMVTVGNVFICSKSFSPYLPGRIRSACEEKWKFDPPGIMCLLA